jgi:hypothetical protein
MYIKVEILPLEILLFNISPTACQMLSTRALVRTFRVPAFYHPTFKTFVVNQRCFCATSPAMTLISAAIANDHRELEEAYNKILQATSADEKRRWQNQFTWELARHSIGEELIVYPVMEKNLTNGKEMADKDRAEHQSVSGFICPLVIMAGCNITSVVVGDLTNLSLQPRLRNIFINSRVFDLTTPNLSQPSKPSGLILPSISKKKKNTILSFWKRALNQRNLTRWFPSSTVQRSSFQAEAIRAPLISHLSRLLQDY